MTSTLKQKETPQRLTMQPDLYLLDANRRFHEDLNPDPRPQERRAKLKAKQELRARIIRDLKFGGAVLTASVVTAAGAIKYMENNASNGLNNPNVAVHPYTVGNSFSDRLLSEVAADMHAVAPNQNYNEELPIIDTYVSPEEAKAGAAAAGEVINFRVDTKAGKLLPKLPDSSAR